MSFEKINKIKKETQSVAFSMAISYLLDKGYNFCKELTDEDINSLEANGIMTKEFVQELVRTARDIAMAEDSPIEIIQYCAAEDVFELDRFCNRYSRNEILRFLTTAISYGNINIDELGNELGFDEEEWGMLKDEIVQCGF